MIECQDCGTKYEPMTDAYRCPDCGAENHWNLRQRAPKRPTDHGPNCTGNVQSGCAS